MRLKKRSRNNTKLVVVRAARSVLASLAMEPLERRLFLSAVSWTGSADANWTNPANWSTGVVPTASDDVTIAVNGGSATIQLTDSEQVASLTLSDTLAITGGGSLFIDSGAQLNGGAIDVGDASSSGQLHFTGTQTLAGTGSILFGADANNAVSIDGNATELTIASGIIIHGNTGSLTGGDGNDTINNQGTISADTTGGTIVIAPDTSTFFDTGTIETAGGTLNLAGTITKLGTIQRHGGVLELSGTIENTNSTLNLTTATGSILLNGGTILGGTVTASGGSALQTQYSGGTLDGVTLGAGSPLDLTSFDSFGPSQVSIKDGLTLDGTTINIGSNNTGNTTGVLTFVGSQAVGGTGDLLFGIEPDNQIVADDGSNTVSAAVITFDAGITIHGESGTLTVNGNSDETFVNEGTISADNSEGTINVGYSDAPFTNDGLLESQGGTLNLTGEFSGLGDLQQHGGAIDLSGTLYNAGRTLSLGSTTGSIGLTGGTISGGTITSTGGAAILVLLNAGGFPGTLDGVTLGSGSPLDLSTGDATTDDPQLRVTNGLTLDGTTIPVGNAAGTTYGSIDFLGPETVGGTGTILLGASNDNTIASDSDPNMSADTFATTIGSGVTITGGSGFFNAGSTGSVALINEGRIYGNGNSSNLLFEGSGIENDGSIYASNGATLTFDEPVTDDGTGSTTANSPGTIILASNFLGNTTNATGDSPSGYVEFQDAGTQLEAKSQDLGATSAGFTNNFALQSLILDDSASLQLVDQSHNSSGSGNDAVYADTLVVPDDATLDLNGLHLYARDAIIDGSVINGTITMVPGPHALTSDQPSLGALSPDSTSSAWQFFAAAGATSTIVVNPTGNGGNAAVMPSVGSVDVQVQDPDRNVIAQSTSDPTTGIATLTDVSTSISGTYTVTVSANADSSPDGSSGVGGTFSIAQYNVTPQISRLSVGTTESGTVEPLNDDEYTFAASANEPVKLYVLARSDPGVTFSLVGPDGYQGFTDITATSDQIILPEGGTYTLLVNGPGVGGSAASYAFELAETKVTDLAEGSTYSGTFAASGDAQVFKIGVSAASPLLINLTDSSANDDTELFAKFGEVPTDLSYGYASTATGGNQSIVIPKASVGSYYVLVYGASVANGDSFKLSVNAQPIIVSSVSPNSGGVSNQTQKYLDGGMVIDITNPGAALAVFQVKGAGFTPDTTVTLVGGNGKTYATSATYDSSTLLTAQFESDLTPPGVYSILIQRSDGTSYTVNDGFTVNQPVAGGGGNAALQIPSALGRHTAAVLKLNIGGYGSAYGAPLVFVEPNNSNGEELPILTLNSALYGAGTAYQATLPPGFSNSVGVVASGAAPGFISSGDDLQIPIYYEGVEASSYGLSSIGFQIVTIPTYDTDTFDFRGALYASLRPPNVSDTAWNQIFANFQTLIGADSSGFGELGRFVSEIDNVGQYFGKLGENSTNLDDYLNFLVGVAGGLTTTPSIESSLDVSLPATGVPLTFSRTFNQTIAGRSAMGAMGLGWTSNWSSRLTVNSDGSAAISAGTGTEELFSPKANSTTDFTAQPGDSNTLALVNGEYILTSSDGAQSGYSSTGNLDFIRDRNGNSLTAAYNGTQLQSVTSSSGASFSVAYNSAGLISAITDSTGEATKYFYDSTNTHLTSVQSADGEVTTYTYASSGADINALTTVGLPDGEGRSYSYNSDGWLSGAAGTGGAEAETINYGALTGGDIGSVTSTDALGDAGTVYFDQDGRVVRATDPDGNTSTVTFNSLGEVVQSTDADLGSVTYTYNQNANLTSMTDALGNSTYYGYDSSGRVTSSTDANGNQTTYTYDKNGNELSATFANGTSTSFTYDPQGDALTFVDQAGNLTDFVYGAAGQVMSATTSDGTVYSFAYNARGQITSASSTSSGTIQFTYDPTTDALTHVAYPNGHSLTFSYDALVRRSQMVDQTGFTVNYHYDDNNDLTSLTDASGNTIVQYSYDAAGGLSRTTNENGTYTTYAYDAAGYLLHLINYAPGGAVNSRFDYTYNALGLVTSEAILDGTWTYAYDAAGQLTSAVFDSTNSSVPSQNLSYTYDAAGNRITSTENGVTTNYTTNNMNQYTAVGGVPYTYDADGDLLSDGVNTYTYNDQNQLTSITSASGTTSYNYDALGFQAGLTSASGAATSYLVDPITGNVESEYNSTGNQTDAFTYGLGLTSSTSAAGTDFYDTDSLDSIVGVSNASGNYVDSYSYKPFGDLLSSLTTIPNTFQFVGAAGVTTDLSGIYNMHARDYSSADGRFDAVDPLGSSGGSSNFYQYALNDPTNDFDPAGESPLNNPYSAPPYSPAPYSPAPYSPAPYSPAPYSPPPYSGPGSRYSPAPYSPAPYGNRAGRDAPSPYSPAPYTTPADAFKHSGDPLDPNPISPFGPSTPPNPAPPAGPMSGPSPSTPANNPVPPGSPDPAAPDPDAPEPTPSDPTEEPPGFIPDDPDPPVAPLPGLPGPSTQSPLVQAFDPNALIGPSGYGTSNFVSGTASLPYQIDFENDPTATAPAQEVTLTEQLPKDLDWSSLQLGTLGFGSVTLTPPAQQQNYQTSVSITENHETFNVIVTINFDSITGVLSADFQSIDPKTLLPPDVLTGFLPPEDGTGRGSGYVSYSIAPKNGLPTGTAIRSVATVVFDGETAIATDQVSDTDPTQGTDSSKEALVTLDTGAPTSSVTAPATTTATSFNVNWSGTDDAGGSGIANYSIYVSDDGGAFSLWLANTTDTSDTFTGVAGHTYGFYSIATDNVGNVEASKTTADSTTNIIAPPDVSSFTVNDGSPQRSMVRTLTVTFTSPVTLDSGAITLSKISGSTSTPVTFTASTSDGGLTYVLTPTSNVSSGSLTDGNYSLTINPTGVHSASDSATTLSGTTRTYSFFRLFGDITGDGTVNLLDYKQFTATYLKSTGQAGFNPNFDFDGNGTINLVDYKAFTSNYLHSIMS